MHLLKVSGLTLLLLAGYPLFAQQQEEEDGPAHKAALQRMIDERGGASNMGRYAEEMQAYRNNNPQTLAANWSYISDAGTANGDLGRTNCVTQDTLNAGRYYVCTPHSGVWLTNNDGASYTPITEALPTQSVSRLVIDPTNTNVLYIATGAHNFDMPPNSLGVFKSIDGGLTWNATGLTFSAAATVNIGDLVINPENHNSLIAATTDGLYRTFNGGTTWTRILNDTMFSVRYKPGDTATMFAVGRRFYRTDDGWTNWAMITSTFQDGFQWRYEYAVRVSEATPNLVYLLTQGLNIGPGARAYIHTSTDGGWSFTLIDSLTGQSNVQFDVSQQTPYKYIIGYHRVYKRENAVSSLVQMTNSTTTLTPYVHVDQRGISFDPRNDQHIYLCNDGGLKRSTDNGATFVNLNANMQLAHIYNFGQSQSTPYKILPAPLDISPFMLGPSGITRTFPLVEAFIAAMSPVNDSVYMLGHFNPYFTNNDWNSFYSSSQVMLGNASNWPKSFHFSETQENISYHASQGYVYRSTDYGANHPLMMQTPWYIPDWQYELDVSGANANYLYLRFPDSLYMTPNNGGTFLDITPGLPMDSVSASTVTVDPQNEENVWVAFSGYTSGQKVYFSPDAGQTWTNMSAGLPNVPVNDIVCDPNGAAGAVYCATDGGVFYRDSTFSAWQLYSTNLPAGVIITDLDIQHSYGKLRASTFGRGMWESDLYTPTGIDEPSTGAGALFLYPNPASNHLFIRSTQALGTITIIDITGRKISEYSTPDTNAVIDVSGLAAGCYFIQAGTEVAKFQKR